MSNVPGGMPIASYVNSEVDFTSKEAYVANSSQTDAAFMSIVPLTNYSSSLITVKLNLSNALSQLLDRIIILNVPVRFDITGQRKGAVGSPLLLADGEFGVRSNSFLKSVNVSTVNLGTGSSYSLNTDSGLIINALESSAPMFSTMRQLNNMDNVMVDNVANYDDALYTNRNVLGLYNNHSGNELGRSAYDIEILSNTTTTASILVTYRFAIFVSPLLQDISVHGSQHALSHIDSLNLNFALTNLNTRLLSFARTTNNGKLVISNITPFFGSNVAGVPQPVLEFQTYNVLNQSFVMPERVSYPLPVIERFSNLVSVPRGTTAVVSSPVVSLNSVPSYALVYACYPESLYSSQAIAVSGDPDTVHGTQLTDSFCPISRIEAQVNAVNLQNNSTTQSLWRAYIQNGGNKTFAEWSGRPLIKTLNSPDGIPKYMYPASGPVKLAFGSDLTVKVGNVSLSPGTQFKFNASFTCSVTNTTPYSDQLVLYVVYVHPQVLLLQGINESSIITSPLSVENCISLQGKQPTSHSSVLNTHDLTGYGMYGKTHRLMTNPRLAHKLRKSRLHRMGMMEAIKSVMPSVSGGMKNIPDMEAMVKGYGLTGGKKKGRSRKSAVRF